MLSAFGLATTSLSSSSNLNWAVSTWWRTVELRLTNTSAVGGEIPFLDCSIPDSSVEECEKVESLSAFECCVLISSPSFNVSNWRAIGFACTVAVSSFLLNMFDCIADSESSNWPSSSNASSRRAVEFSSTVDTPWEISLSLTRLDLKGILKDWEAILRVLVAGPDLRAELGSDVRRLVGCGCRLAVDGLDAVTPGIFFPQQSTLSQSSRPSLPNTQKKRKMKKPCSELNMAKRVWKTTEALLTVKAPNNHVSPKRAITPMVLIRSLVTVCRFVLSVVPNFFLVCLMRMLITMTNMTELKRRMAKMGPRKAPKNTPGLPMKQLEGTK